MMVRKPNEKEMTMGEGKAVLAVGAIMVDMLCQVPRLPRSGEGIVVEESRAVVGGCAFNAANVLRQLGAPYELRRVRGTRAARARARGAAVR